MNHLFVFCSIDKNNAVSKELKKLLKIPVDSYNDILRLLQLEHFSPLFDYFDYASRKEMAIYLISNAVENESRIGTQEQVPTAIETQLVTSKYFLKQGSNTTEAFNEHNDLVRVWTWTSQSGVECTVSTDLVPGGVWYM